MSGTEILVTALGGITLLLWGCRMVRTGVIRAYGSKLQRFIGNWSSNRVRAAVAGAGAGTALQSSTAAALLVSAFVGQGAIAASPALAIMLGADLGSAIAASIFSSGISIAWPVMAFGGYVIHTAYDGRNVRVKNIGRILIGLGLLFLGLRIIGSAAADLSSSFIVTQLIEATSSEPVLALLVGAALTWVA
ncbi:MAG: Na/Pi symporter, partial [Methyloligellaceae bacterium]